MATGKGTAMEILQRLKEEDEGEKDLKSMRRKGEREKRVKREPKDMRLLNKRNRLG